jgi:plastocyanin
VGRALALSLIVAAGALAAGCGEKKTTTTASGQAPTTGSALSIQEKEFSLTPASAKVSKPGAVQVSVSNGGSIPHALEVQTKSGAFRTKPIPPGGSTVLKLSLKPGTYTWFCPIDGHRGRGMKGTLTIAAGGNGAGGSSGGKGGSKGKGGGSSGGGSGY